MVIVREPFDLKILILFSCFISGSNASREAELAMWKRRASYDPMKAAAEGKKKQEEARKALHTSKFNERFDRFLLIFMCIW